MSNFFTTYIQLLTEGLVDTLKAKYVPGKVSESEFNAALDADPTPKKKYLIWLLRNLEYDLVKQEDLYKAKEYIPIVEKLRDKKMIDPKFVNPNETKTVMKTDPYDGKQKPVKVPKFSFDEFKNYAIRFKEDEDVQLDSKSDIKEKTKVYETENWEIFVPKTYEQSCVLGKGTEWCTATEKTDKYYKHYTNDGIIYILINKEDPGMKYQFHFGGGQFMDKDDYPINLYDFFQDNPSLEKFFRKREMPSIRKYYEVEEINGGFYKTFEDWDELGVLFDKNSEEYISKFYSEGFHFDHYIPYDDFMLYDLNDDVEGELEEKMKTDGEWDENLDFNENLRESSEVVDYVVTAYNYAYESALTSEIHKKILEEIKDNYGYENPKWMEVDGKSILSFEMNEDTDLFTKYLEELEGYDDELPSLDLGSVDDYVNIDQQEFNNYILEEL